MDLLSNTNDIHLPTGNAIFIEDEVAPGAVYFLRSGKVYLKKEMKVTKIITKGDFFGEDTLFVESDGAEHIARSSAIVSEDAIIGVLSKNTIISIINDMSRLFNPVRATRCAPSSRKLLPKVSFSDLKKHRLLGVGSWAQVWLVSNTKANCKDAYALKVQSKSRLIRKNHVHSIIREKKVMERLDHPFISKLICTYQDPGSTYMLIDLVQGGELYNLIYDNNRNIIDEYSAKFYAAVVLEGLSHMHHCQVIYRDLKPANILIDKVGYPILTDFGLAKIVQDKAYTVCGSPLYVAPEVTLNRGECWLL